MNRSISSLITEYSTFIWSHYCLTVLSSFPSLHIPRNHTKTLNDNNHSEYNPNISSIIIEHITLIRSQYWLPFTFTFSIFTQTQNSHQKKHYIKNYSEYNPNILLSSSSYKGKGFRGEGVNIQWYKTWNQRIVCPWVSPGLMDEGT